MENEFSRTENLIGKENIEILKEKHIIIFGLGGVGSYTAEALARAGIGALTVIDRDTVSLSNINRQLYALHSTVGKPKVEVAKERILDINPCCKVTAIEKFYLPENAEEFSFENIDYIIDAIDNVSAKLDIIKRAKAAQIPVISCMGTGNKTDASKFEISDISKTVVCPLAKIIRTSLRKEGINHLKVVYSKEEPRNIGEDKRTPASISFVPSVAGLLLCQAVISDIIK